MFGPVGVKAAKIGILGVRCNKSKCQRHQILKSSSAEEKAKSSRVVLTAGPIDEAVTHAQPCPARPVIPVTVVIIIMISEKPILTRGGCVASAPHVWMQMIPLT